jgi:dihydroneopterin aldolase
MLSMERIQFYGKHGVMAEENQLGQRFYVSLTMRLDLSVAGQTDRLEETVNYAEVYTLVKKIVEGETYRLIEALAETIASRLLDSYARIMEVTVRVVKPHPPIHIIFDGVAVEITRTRYNT